MSESTEIEGKIAGLRMIVLTLFMGLSVMGVIMIFSATRMNGPLIVSDTLAYGLLGTGVVTAATGLAAGTVIRTQVAKSSANGAEVARFQSFMSITVIQAALMEGPALLLLVAFVITHNWFVLAPVPILMLLLLMQLPSRSKYQEWSERMDRLKDEASL